MNPAVLLDRTSAGSNVRIVIAMRTFRLTL
jgi:hypothetical protein